MSSGGDGGIRRRGAPSLCAAAAKRVRLTQPVSTTQPPPLLVPAAETQLVCTEENPMAVAKDEAEALHQRCNEVAMLIHHDEVFASGLLRCKRHALPADLAAFFSHIIGNMWIEPPDADGKYFMVLPFHKLSFDLRCADPEGHFPVGTNDAVIQRSWAQRIIESSEHYSRNYGLQQSKDAAGSLFLGEQVICTDKNPKAAAEDEAMLLPPCDKVEMLLHHDEALASRHSLPANLSAFFSHIIGSMWIEPPDADRKYFLVLPFHKLSFDLHCTGQEGHFLVGADDTANQRSWSHKIMKLPEHDSRLYGQQESRDATGSVAFLGEQPFDAKAQCSGDKSVIITQVFVKHLSGTLSLQVDVEKDVQLFKEEVQQRLQLDVSQFIFIYGLHTLEAGKSLSFYGIEKNATISLCDRCRGGRRYQTLLLFYHEHANELLRTVQLPDGYTEVELTEVGCILLASLIQLFTSVFVSGKTWNGKFGLHNFKVIRGRVRIKLQPRNGLTSSSLKNDCIGLTGMIEAMFVKDGIYPPYLKHLIQKLNDLDVDVFTDDLQLAFNSHISLILSLNRVSLVYLIKVNYDGWSEKEKQRFRDVVNSCTVPDDWINKLKKVPLLCDLIFEGQKRKMLFNDGHGAFCLVRNYNTHASKHSWMKLKVQHKLELEDYQWCKCNNGIELMVPKYLGDFLAEVVHLLIEEKFDIKDVLLACSGAVFNIFDSALDSNSSSSDLSSSSSSSSSDLAGSSSESKKKGKRRHSVNISKKRKRIDLSSSSRKRRHSVNVSKKRKRIDLSSSSRLFSDSSTSITRKRRL